MLKLMIADSSEEYVSAMKELVSGDYELQTCSEGHDALQIIRTFQPDLMILDLMLPGMDGISVLQTAQQEGIRPAVLATALFINDYVLRALEKLNVDYVMMKPCDLNASAARLADLVECGKNTGDRTEARVVDLLALLEVPVRLRGYRYLLQAIEECIRQPGQMITKEVYPVVGRKNDVSAAQVERSIRSAIKAAWEKRDERQWQRFFAPGRDGVVERPTNAEFMFTLADRLRVGK